MRQRRGAAAAAARWRRGFTTYCREHNTNLPQGAVFPTSASHLQTDRLPIIIQARKAFKTFLILLEFRNSESVIPKKLILFATVKRFQHFYLLFTTLKKEYCKLLLVCTVAWSAT